MHETDVGKLKAIIREAHFLLEAKEGVRLSQKEMAERVGVKHRTFVEYERGGNEPAGMKALLNLLSQLEDSEIIRIVRKWQTAGTKKQEYGW